MTEEVSQEELEKAFFEEYGLTFDQVVEITVPICKAFAEACRDANLPAALCAGAAINIADGIVRAEKRADLAQAYGLRFIQTHLELGGTGMALSEVPPREEMN